RPTAQAAPMVAAGDRPRDDGDGVSLSAIARWRRRVVRRSPEWCVRPGGELNQPIKERPGLAKRFGRSGRPRGQNPSLVDYAELGGQPARSPGTTSPPEAPGPPAPG